MKKGLEILLSSLLIGSLVFNSGCRSYKSGLRIGSYDPKTGESVSPSADKEVPVLYNFSQAEKDAEENERPRVELGNIFSYTFR